MPQNARSVRTVRIQGVLFSVALAVIAGCAGHHLSPPKTTPSPSASPTVSPSASPTASPTPSGSATPTPSPSIGTSTTPTPEPTPSINKNTLATDLKNFAAAGATFTNVVLRGTDDAWAVTYNGDQWDATDIPVTLAAELAHLNATGATIGPIALGPNGSWVVVSGNNQFTSYGLTTDMYNVLATASTNSADTISAIAMGPDGSWVVIINGSTVETSNTIPALTTYLDGIASAGTEPITHVAIGANDTWVVISGLSTSSYSVGIPSAMAADLGAITSDGYQITSVALGLAGSYAITYGKAGYFETATRSQPVATKTK